MQNQESNMFKTGDLIIGSSDPSKSIYSPTGAKLSNEEARIYGSPEDIHTQQQQLTNILLGAGGQRLDTSSVNGKSRKKKKTTSLHSWNSVPPPSEPIVYHEPVAPPAPVESTVQFENDFGKMKAKVISCIEHEMAFMLTFKDEDSVLFEPKVGEHLFFYTPDKYRYAVYYPGVTFDSPGSSEKFMILFKVPEENQE